MSNVPPPDITEDFLTLLRTSAEVMPTPARDRLGARLVAASTLPLPGEKAANAAKIGAGSVWRSPRVAALFALPLGALLGVGAYRASSQKTPNATHANVARTMNPVPSLPSATAAEMLPALPATSAPSLVPARHTLPRSASPKASPLPTDSATPTTSSAPLSDSDADLSLLEQARSVFAEGDAALTLQLVNAHERRFPASPFSQEREALTIKSLVAIRRKSEAEARAEAFAKLYPQSPLRASVQRAVGKKP